MPNLLKNIPKWSIILWPRTKKVIKENLLCTQGRIFQPSLCIHSDLKLRAPCGNCTSYTKLLKSIPKLSEILWPRTKKVIKENLLCTQGRIFQSSLGMHSDLKLIIQFQLSVRLFFLNLKSLLTKRNLPKWVRIRKRPLNSKQNRS